MLEEIRLSHLPPSLSLYIGLYQSVQNAAFLRQQLLTGNTDFEYALIDASMVHLLHIFYREKFSPLYKALIYIEQIVSRTHILAACFRALNDYLSGRLKSRNVHSEIVFALSPNNNVCTGSPYHICSSFYFIILPFSLARNGL